MSRRPAIAAIVLGFAWLTFATQDAAAQKVYKWKDKDGKVHFSNVAPANEAGAEESSGVTGIEAQNPQAPPAPAPAAPDVATEDMPREAAVAQAGPSDEEFSAKVSSTRMRLKRELAQAKNEWTEASDKLAALKKENDEPTRMGIEILQKAYGPEAHASSDEADLRKRKEKAEARMNEIRKQYADLQAEAVKRYGSKPGWWLSIE